VIHAETTEWYPSGLGDRLVNALPALDPIRQELLIGPLLGLFEDASRLPLGTRRDEELYGTDRVGAFAAFTSNIDGDALGFESAFGDLCLDP